MFSPLLGPEMRTVLLQSPLPEMNNAEGREGYLIFETKFGMLFVLWFKIYGEMITGP